MDNPFGEFGKAVHGNRRHQRNLQRPPAQLRAGRYNECRSVVVVSSGDTLSKLLLEQGLDHNDVNVIAKVLKQDAEITTLRAERDKLEFVRPKTDAPVSKIVVIPSPWRQVELTCNESRTREICSLRQVFRQQIVIRSRAS